MPLPVEPHESRGLFRISFPLALPPSPRGRRGSVLAAARVAVGTSSITHEKIRRHWPPATFFSRDLIIHSSATVSPPPLASSLSRETFRDHELYLPTRGGKASLPSPPSCSPHSLQLDDIRRAKLHFATKLHLLDNLVVTVVVVVCLDIAALLVVVIVILLLLQVFQDLASV